MIEKLSGILETKYEYNLEEYALYEMKKKASRLFIFTSAIFVVFLVIGLLDLFSIWENFMTPALLLFLFIFLVAVPLSFKKGAQYDGIVVTPDLLAQKKDKEDVQIIFFDEITQFNITKEGIRIKDKKSTILLGLNMFREEIDPIINILEAKGKTFDSSKDYMIRPIEIHIVDNRIVIKDIVKVSKENQVYEHYQDEYEYMTPGFLKEIYVRHSLIEDYIHDDELLILYLNKFLVTKEHPENTSFDSIQVEDGAVIFGNPKVKLAVIMDPRGKQETKTLDNTVEAITPYLKRSLFGEQTITKECANFVISVGNLQMQLQLCYDFVITGWNNIVE